MSAQRQFQQDLDQLQTMLVRMAGAAEEAFRSAIDALRERSREKARAVVERDRVIDDLELEIHELAIHLLALQQPLAKDLRFITMAMQISNDLERVGDHAVNIAREVDRLLDAPAFPPLPEIHEMTRLAGAMLNDALGAFVSRDSEAAREILVRDDEVDELHGNIFRILLTHMMEDPRRIGPGMDLFLVSRNIERVADLATNIAEDVVFLVEGRIIKHHAEARGILAGDQTSGA